MTEIFVFGSNLAGKHIGGAALHAHENYGAHHGCPIGPQGHSYAIATLDAEFVKMPLYLIEQQVDCFIKVAESTPNYTFIVTAIGCGIAGFTPYQIAPMFELAQDLPNVILPKEFL